MGKRLVLSLGLVGLLLTAYTVNVVGQEKRQTDEQFVLTASGGNLAEIEHGKLAEEKASDPAVKDFARTMITDHGKANQELTAIAKKKGYKVATQLPKEHHDMQMKLKGLQGAEFDRHYMRHMVENHQKGVKLYQTQASSGQDADLKAFAAKVLPTVQKHLSMAQSISGKLGGSK